jgi:hypothetical protein
MNYIKSENCEAWAKPEKPKMRLRFDTKPIFTLFSRAVPIISATRQSLTSLSSAWSSSCYLGSKNTGPYTERATIQFFYGTSSSPIYTKNIDTNDWKPYSFTVQSPSTSETIYAEIKFIADPGGYAYISTTDFGTPGGIS